MSANTVITIKKVKNEFQVKFKDVESSGYFDKKILTNLEEALKYAKKIQDTKEVEFGIYIESL